MASILDTIDAITEHQKEVFNTKTGLEFTYTIHGERLVVSRTDFTVHLRRNVRRALALMEQGAKASEISSKVFGSSYINAILSDPRIKGNGNKWYEATLTDNEDVPEYKEGAGFYIRKIDDSTVAVRSMGGFTLLTLPRETARRRFNLGKPVKIAE